MEKRIEGLSSRFSAMRIRLEAAAAKLRQLGLDPGPPAAKLATADIPAAEDDRDLTTRVILASRLGAAISDRTQITKVMTRLARATGDAAPSFEFDQDLGVTTVGYRGMEQMFLEFPYDLEPFLDQVGRWLEDRGWPFRIVAVEDARNERLVLVPAAVVAELARIARLTGGAAGARPAASPPPRFSPPSVRTPAEIVGEERLFTSDGECIDAAADYERVVADIASICAGALPLEHVRCVEENAGRALSFRVANRSFRAVLLGDTNWADLPPLLACLNEALAHVGVSHRLIEFREAGWGQEFGLAYADERQRQELCDGGYAVVATRP